MDFHYAKRKILGIISSYQIFIVLSLETNGVSAICVHVNVYVTKKLAKN
jgi:hypothetical protein